MGNKLSSDCSCGPLMRKGYRYEDSPWQNCKRRDGHLLRLWAEVFHVSSSGSGSIKWQQVSEDLVPVNITCVQDTPECVFHITAYNSQVDKILDVRLVQPGTRIGQASECFVYWKESTSNDTWGLNFTSPIDAKQFRECCSPSFKLAHKSNAYSLKIDAPSKQGKNAKNRRKPSISTPASPSHGSKDPQCTCMTPDQYNRLRAQDPRFRASTLPRIQTKVENVSEKEQKAVSRTFSQEEQKRQTRDTETATPGGRITNNSTTVMASQTEEQNESPFKNEGVQAVIQKTTTGTCTPRNANIQDEINVAYASRGKMPLDAGSKYGRDEFQYRGAGNGLRLDSNTLKRMLKPMPSLESPLTSPETSRKRYYPMNNICAYHHSTRDGALSEPESGSRYKPRISSSRSTHDVCKNRDYSSNRLYLNFDNGIVNGRSSDGRLSSDIEDLSPPSDNDLFDNRCYATTPTSSNDRINETSGGPGSPTSRLLLEYEMHLRNALARGMDAESYSLHTFEALLSQSMENLEFAEKIDARNAHINRSKRTNGILRAGTLPHQRSSLERASSCSRGGYYSDRNDGREIDRGYMSDRDRGYVSDHYATVSSNRCNTCLNGGTTRHPLYRHSSGDGWRPSNTGRGFGLGSSFQESGSYNSKRSAWESLPSLRHENSFTDGNSKLGRCDSLERKSALRSHEYCRLSDRDGYLSHQTSTESADSKLCYLTSSETDPKEMVESSSKCPRVRRLERDQHKKPHQQQQQHQQHQQQQRRCRTPNLPEKEVTLWPAGRENTIKAKSAWVFKPWNKEDGDALSDTETLQAIGARLASTTRTSRKHQKSVHFIEHPIKYRSRSEDGCREEEGVCCRRDRSLGSVVSLPDEFNKNVTHLFTFIGTVLSAWDDTRDVPVTTSAVALAVTRTTYTTSDLGRELRARQRQKDVLRYLLYSSQSKLNIEDNVGSFEFQHKHWKIAPSTCNALFLKKISDDDRMSLTTAISDDDELDDNAQSPYVKAKKRINSASFNCTGAVRKAGFLSVKKWLLRKKQQIELARKRGWKGYWVCLKGTTLLFYPCDSRDRHAAGDAAPKHLIIVDGAILQAIPEHPKRDYVFCLSTTFGDAYLFQAPCQAEVENWINSIHSACAAAFARHRGKIGTFHLLSEESFKVEKALEADHKMKHMTELQLSVVTDPAAKEQLNNSVMQYEENLERLYCEQFRLRCYLCCLQNGELPNPKNLLTHVSRPTKQVLNKLGVFTVSSFHAYICARSPSFLSNLLAGRSNKRSRTPMQTDSNRRSLSREDERAIKVNLPDNQVTQIYLRDGMTVEEYIATACARKNLNSFRHFVRVKKRRDMEDHNYFVPPRNDLIEPYINTHEVVEICVKVLYQVELTRTSTEHLWGFSVEAELIEEEGKQDELLAFVSRVEDRGAAISKGIIKGDEIMIINGAIVSDLDMMFIESVLQEESSLLLMMRSSRTEAPTSSLAASGSGNTDDIDSLVCPPPPGDAGISEEMISGLIVPAPAYANKEQEYADGRHIYAKISHQQQPAAFVKRHERQASRTSSFEIDNLVKSADEVTGFCRSPVEGERCSPSGSLVNSQSHAAVAVAVPGMPGRALTDAEKLRKVILELIDTERAYVKHLNNLLEYYLEPLKNETFLTEAEISVLFGNIEEIIAFQRQFLRNLNEALSNETKFYEFEQPSQFKNILFSIGSAFLYYVDNFKLYSSFCASHSKAQKILNPSEGNYALQEFLAAQNPRQQHSSTLESYLIKPIQRIVKYPMLLLQLRNLTEENSDEYLHLAEALNGMEKVAEHINEMQRIHEEYGAIFDHLFRQHQKPIDLSPADLLYYGGVEWINVADFLGKIKKGLELHAMCFVFKSAVVFLCKERVRQKKKLMDFPAFQGASKGDREVEIIRYQVLIPVSDVQVRPCAKERDENHFVWELIHMRSYPQRRSERYYVLSNTTNEFRSAFIRTIRTTIRESVRAMNIPLLPKIPKPPTVPDDNLIYATIATDRVELKLDPDSVKPYEEVKSECSKAPNNAENASLPPLAPKPKGKKIPPKPPQRRSSAIIEPVDKTVVEYATVKPKNPPIPAQRPKIADFDPGTKSSEDDDGNSKSGGTDKSALGGKTPNHLTLSTLSTISASSTGSQARLIQSSHHPQHYQPPTGKDLGSPVWKPRDMGESLTLPRKNKPNTAETRTLGRNPDKAKGGKK